PGAGGDERPPIRFYGGHPFPVKRRTVDIGGDDPRFKRHRHAQYAFEDQVSYKAAPDEFHGFDGGGQSFPQHHTSLHAHPHLHHPHPQQPPSYPQPHPHPHVLPPLSSDQPAPCAMERTASGLSIQPEPTERCARTELLEDDEAAQRVRDHMATFRRRNPDSKHERILRSIINPRSNAEYPLDNDSLESIFSAANEMFFNGRLSQRVMWDWSHASSPRYDSSVIGTTALRRASNRGFETLIVLSSPILQNSRYSRRLLISTFLHELIHSYLFICCGFRARYSGGHTPGFHAIARLIDDWAGSDSALHLGKMEADLERFRIAEGGGGGQMNGVDDDGRPDYYDIYPCSGLAEEQQ
ncbi:hypothetical protein B0T17DRAFT_467907, partial [Bombardia bombarda]